MMSKKTVLSIVNVILLIVFIMLLGYGIWGVDRNSDYISYGQRYIISMPDGKIIEPLVSIVGEDLDDLSDKEIVEDVRDPNIKGVTVNEVDLNQNGHLDNFISKEEGITSDVMKREENNTDAIANVINIKKHNISILLAGVGLDKHLTERALKLPKDITLSFGAHGLQRNHDIFEKVIASGRGVFVDLKLESDVTIKTKDSSSLKFLTTKLEREEGMSVLRRLLTNAGGVIGIHAFGSKKFFDLIDYKDDIFSLINNKNLAFLYGSFIGELGRCKSLVSDVFLDKTLQKQEILSKLDDLVEMSKNKGFAIGIARSYPMMFDILEEWLSNRDDINLVPLNGEICQYVK